MSDNPNTTQTLGGNRSASFDSSPAPCSPSVVYVVATGGIRIAIESEHELPLAEVSSRAIERFCDMGMPMLGLLMEVTECSDHADAGDPHYISTEAVLKEVGRWHDASLASANAGRTDRNPTTNHQSNEI